MPLVTKISSLIVSLLILLTCSNSAKMKTLPYVTGTITSIELIEIPNKAKNKKSRYETRISLNIIDVYDYEGKQIPANLYDYPYFAGDSSLIDKFTLNQKVKIICSSKTGRQIDSIEIIK